MSRYMWFICFIVVEVTMVAKHGKKVTQEEVQARIPAHIKIVRFNCVTNFYVSCSCCHKEIKRDIATLQRTSDLPTCRKCYLSTKKDSVTFKSLFKELGDLWNNLYKYEALTEKYEGVESKIKIYCPVEGHKPFIKRIHNHKGGQGCPKCARISQGQSVSKRRNTFVYTKEDYIKERNLNHKDNYDYSLLPDNISNSRLKLQIICPNHTESFIFSQKALNHLRGEGCPKCGKIRTALYHSEANFISFTGYKNLCDKNYDGMCSIYIIRLYNDFESFFKIGKTVNFNKRFNSNNMPYSIEPLFIFKGESIFCSKLERQLQRTFKENRYTTSIEFPGHRECFFNIDGILDHIPLDQVEVITDLLSQQEIAA